MAPSSTTDILDELHGKIVAARDEMIHEQITEIQGLKARVPLSSGTTWYVSIDLAPERFPFSKAELGGASYWGGFCTNKLVHATFENFLATTGIHNNEWDWFLTAPIEVQKSALRILEESLMEPSEVSPLARENERRSFEKLRRHVDGNRLWVEVYDYAPENKESTRRLSLNMSVFALSRELDVAVYDAKRTAKYFKVMQSSRAEIECEVGCYIKFLKQFKPRGHNVYPVVLDTSPDGFPFERTTRVTPREDRGVGVEAYLQGLSGYGVRVFSTIPPERTSLLAKIPEKLMTELIKTY